MVNVLFVDDEIMVINSIRRSIHDKEFGKFYATSADEAIEIVKNNEIGVVVSDMKMPKRNGLQLMIEIQAINKDIVKIILSGYSQLPQIVAAINHVSIFKYITKPWDLDDELLPAIEEGMEQYQSIVSIKKSNETIDRQNTLYKNMLSRYDEKILNVVTGMNNIAQMAVLITEYMKDLVSFKTDEDKDPTRIEFDGIKQFVRMYLDDVISYDKKFSAKYFLNLLEEFIGVGQYDIEYEISNIINEGLSVTGKQATSRSIICSFLAKYLANTSTKKISLQLADKKINDEIRLVMSISVSYESDYPQEDGKAYFDLIHELMIVDGGELVYKVFPDKLLMVFVLGKVVVQME